MTPSSTAARVIVDELVRQGVREAVLCPGSRSAPLAYALLEADRAGRLRLHVRVDERSAGYLAVGLAKLGGPPAVIATTSGTAVANLHPSVLEAGHAGVPLVVLSADRPPELRGTGANQTTDQPHLFGTATRWAHDLGTPAADTPPAVWRSVTARACAAASGLLGAAAGPVHLNVPLREPLVPDVSDDRSQEEGGGPSADARPAAGVRVAEQPWVAVRALSAAFSRPGLAAAPRTLLVLGDLPEPGLAARAVELAGAAGWPVLAEPFGRFDRSAVVPHGALLLSDEPWVAAHRPSRVVVVGRPTLSRALARLLRAPGITVELVAPPGQWPDPSHTASVVHPLGVLQAATPAADDDGSWRDCWQAAGTAIGRSIDEALNAPWPSGVAVARTLLRAMPPAATLFVGSSNPPRDLGLVMARDAPGPDVTVVANRGLAGIDGCVSTAVGVALAEGGRPAYALVGDLSFLHDANALLIGPGEPRPDLTIVVVNDDGGGIFTLLEPGEPDRVADFERVFGTPTGASIGALCRAYGVSHTLVERAGELAERLTEPASGISVLEVRIDRAAHRGLHERLRTLAAAALAPAEDVESSQGSTAST